MIVKLLIALLVAYLGYRLWKGFGTPKPRVVPPGDALAEARAVLGVAADADADAVRAAHRRRVATAHPDVGGSAEEARRINAARDLLLKSLPAA